MREVVQAMLYILETGCLWRHLPKDVSPRSTVREYFDLWRHDGTLARPAASTWRRTRLTVPRKLGLLMSLTALAIAWAGRTAADKLGTHTPPRKSHGHDSKSFFRIGFDQIRNRLRTDPLDAIIPWRRITQERQKVTGVV